MIHLKMLGLGFLTIFKYIGFSVLILLGVALLGTLLGGWFVCFSYDHYVFGVLILFIDFLIISYVIGDYVLHVTIPEKKKAQMDV
ncbi:hypothetical protein [Bacillus vallismortis]|uniref:hypothetical protein n=1 Tax=Bacillus vallismortis TaxID=72361 RepID=UPI002282B84F|nr:hypothetical protein [Bacillus vallismortis]MCY8546428.1 hypothetical protein [Bacillus vallismortis]